MLDEGRFAARISDSGKRHLSSIILIAGLLILMAAAISILTGAEQSYTNVTNTCISCHNDTGYPLDTDNNGVVAPFKRPHNNTVMCESCHGTNPHNVSYIQFSGILGSKVTSASCPECHRAGVPLENNSNFTKAYRFNTSLRHSTNILNGSLWGSYWINTSLETACAFCHNDTKHQTDAFGLPATFMGTNVKGGNLNGTWCGSCHYQKNPYYNLMIANMTKVPPEITGNATYGNYTVAGDNTTQYLNHSSIAGFNDSDCKVCHDRSESTTITQFVHNVHEGAGSDECMVCHSSPTGENGTYAAIDVSSFAEHRNINTTDGVNNLTNADCMVCHYNISNMFQKGYTTDTLTCPDCHLTGNYSAPIIQNHRPPKQPITAGGNISTTAYCTVCHNNSINKFIYSENASVSHYGTTASLVKPTVNQTPMPRFGFMTSADASSYNQNCNNCHNPSNSSYGNATLITGSHTASGTCKSCHINVSAADLHNGSLGIPVNFSCKECHTTYASKYGAPDLTGLSMSQFDACGGGSCHNGAGSDASLDTLAKHNTDRTFAGTGGTTDTVYLNGQATPLTVMKGTIVNVTSLVKDSIGGASRVGGAEYYIDADPGEGKGVPMDPVDGKYDASKGAWESVIATINSDDLSSGTHIIYVRGMDIGKQWSAPQSATLSVQSLGYINGTVRNSIDWPIKGAIVTAGLWSTTTTDDGNYSLGLDAGTYNVTASKQPEYYDTTIPNVNVTQSNTTVVYIVIIGKPTGTLSGVVRTA